MIKPLKHKETPYLKIYLFFSTKQQVSKRCLGDLIIHVTVMSHSRDDCRKEELKLQKWCFFMF
jgi:hypothetical protein